MMKAVGGGGSAIARWVNLDKMLDLIILALPCGVVCFDDQAAISVLALSKALSQLMSSLSRFPLSWMPRSLNGSFSCLRPVEAVMSGSSWAWPKRAYFVLSTFIWRPDISSNCFMIDRISVSWLVGLVLLIYRLMSSA